MEVSLISLDLMVTEVLNRYKEYTETLRNTILNGALSIEDYRASAGILQGFEKASEILTEVARKTINER